MEKPNKILRVTDVIPDIINFIHQLISDGFVYVGKPNKSIYFNVGKYSELFDDNCLNNSNDHDLLNKNTHIEAKLNPEDFALWKAVNNQDISWNSGVLDVGKRRPGRHIECSVMMNKMFDPNVHVPVVLI